MPDHASDAVTRSARGQAAEAAAAEWLEARGCRLLARNHRTARGEVDLICEEAGTLCFVEVRSRATSAHGTPAESVGRAKARRVARAAEDWCLRNGVEGRHLRFDVIAVTLAEGRPEFEHIRAAFDGDGDTRLW